MITINYDAYGWPPYVYQWLFLSPYNNQDREEGWEWDCASVVQLQVESPLSTPGGHDHDGDEDDHDGDADDHDGGDGDGGDGGDGDGGDGDNYDGSSNGQVTMAPNG